MIEIFREVQDCTKVRREHFQKPLRMSSREERDFQMSKKCHICDRRYKQKELHRNSEDPEVNIRVRDHCQITGKYRGSAHRNCNLKLQLVPENIKLPVIFHNLKGYDIHFIMQKLGKLINEGLKDRDETDDSDGKKS